MKKKKGKKTLTRRISFEEESLAGRAQVLTTSASASLLPTLPK